MFRRYQAVAAAAAALILIGAYLAVRAILYTPQEADRPEQTPGPAATQTPTSPSPETVRIEGFVQKFMKVRFAAHPVDRFLSARAANLYGEHATGLWLYDETLPGGPGAQYDGFTVTRSDPMIRKKNIWEVHVRIPITWVGEAPPGEIIEVLTVGPGRTSSGRRRSLVVLDALRRWGRVGDGQGLPLPVARTRHDINFAAIYGDYDELERLTGDVATFAYSFGESGDPIGYWRGLEEGHLPIRDVLTGVLGSRFAKAKGVFMWPAASAKDPSEWSEADRQEMWKLGYRNRQVRRFEKSGAYTGWRVGIRQDGSWLFFVSGD